MPTTRNVARLLAALVFGGLVSVGPVLTVGLGVGAAATPVMARMSDKDTLVFSNGRVVEGKITKETADRVWIEINVAGITSIADYPKSDILSIVRAEKSGEEGEKAPAPAPRTTTAAAKPATPKPEANSNAPKVYVIELQGWFGEDISQTPMRQAVKDAKSQGADYLIFVMNNDWSLARFGNIGEIKDDVGVFDQLWRALDMEPVIREEIPQVFEGKPPKVIFWVKKAMGGAAFLPLTCADIYFAPDGKMGGIGHLTKIFGSTGSERVREKQFSLRLTRAEGIAINGGYPPELIRAMARDDYILSYRMEGGRPVYLERMPESIDEQLLVDDGKDERADSIEQLARGEGNDVLTLNADLAFKLGVSKGTVDSLDDLLFKLGVSRNHQVVKGQSGFIMKNWRDSLENAKRELRRLAQQFTEVPQGGANYQERTQNRGRRKSIINSMQSLLKRYEEAINPNELGIPSYEDLEIIKKQIELEQLADRPDRR